MSRQILFPPLPSAAECRRTLRSYFARSSDPRPVHAVFDSKGVFRFWSVSAVAASRWSEAHLSDAFTIRKVTAPVDSEVTGYGFAYFHWAISTSAWFRRFGERLEGRVPFMG